MAYTTKLSLLVFLVLLAISEPALAGRQILEKSKDVDVKQPEFLFQSDPSFLIPGIGRVLVPSQPHLSIPSINPPPSIGGGSYLPGGDDTLVPNPGNEVPNPGRASFVPARAYP